MREKFKQVHEIHPLSKKRLGRIEQFAEELGLPSSALLVFAQVQMDYAKFAQKWWLDKVSRDRDMLIFVLKP